MNKPVTQLELVAAKVDTKSTDNADSVITNTDAEKTRALTVPASAEFG